MKPITNILLVASLLVYVFMPFFNVEFEGGWTGLDYVIDTINKSESLYKQIFSLLPFVACFGGVMLNSFKNRYWGIAVVPFTLVGIFFYEMARELCYIQSPEFYKIISLGLGFNIGYGLMLAALASAVISVMPFAFNKLHEIPVKIRDIEHKIEHKIDKKHDKE